MSGSVESEARKALNRLRRAVEKVEHELADIQSFIEEQAERLEEKILHAGGLEPGRIRRSSS